MINNDFDSDSSGIALSDSIGLSESNLIKASERLKYRAEKQSLVKLNVQPQIFLSQSYSHQKFTPFFPRIDGDLRNKVQAKHQGKRQNPLTSFPKLEDSTDPGTLPTEGKYKCSTNIVPVLQISSPAPPRFSISPQSIPLFLKGHYLKKRRQLNSGFTETNMTQIANQYSESRYLKVLDSHCSPSGKTSIINSNLCLPEIPFSEKWMTSKSKKVHRYVWVSRLSAWIPENQNSNMDYFQLGYPSTITVKHLPICCEFHDFYHHALNKDIKTHPKYCERCLRHRNQKKPNLKPMQTPSKRDSLQKTSTNLKDPFSSKSERNLKHSWLKTPTPSKEAKTQFESYFKDKVRTKNLKVVSPHEEKSEFHLPRWMRDNFTMTENSLSEVPSIILSQQSDSNTGDCEREPFYTNKKRKMMMVDQACDAMTPFSLNSPPISQHTTKSRIRDLKESFELNIDRKAGDLQTFQHPIQSPSDGSLYLKKDCISGEKHKNDDIKKDNQTYLKDFTPNEGKYAKNVEIGKSKNDEMRKPECRILLENSENEKNINSTSYQKTSTDKVNQLRKRKERKKPQLPPLRFLEEQSKPNRNINKLLNANNITKPESDIVVPQPGLTDRLDGLERPDSLKLSLFHHEIPTITPIPSTKSLKRKGKPTKDQMIVEARLAEERKRRTNKKFVKIKNSRKTPHVNPSIQFQDSVDDDFLGKYCIHNPRKMEEFKRIFNFQNFDSKKRDIGKVYRYKKMNEICKLKSKNHVFSYKLVGETGSSIEDHHYIGHIFNNYFVTIQFDSDEDGLLNPKEVFVALQKVMPSHSTKSPHINHIYRLLEMADYKIESEKIDFKLFAILASLAQRISTLDEFMKGLIDNFDFQSLNEKMWRAYQFFKYFADDEEKQTISMESLWIELKAGGIEPTHERQIRESLKHLPYLDLLDFMTYLPLFTFTHSHAIFDPLNNKKKK